MCRHTSVAPTIRVLSDCMSVDVASFQLKPLEAFAGLLAVKELKLNYPIMEI